MAKVRRLWVDAETGETFIKALKDGKRLTFKMVGPKSAELRILTTNNTMSGGAVSEFSSWSPTFKMRSKPQYGAIGGTLFNDGTKFYDYLAPVPQQGGGLVQVDDAAYSTALLSPSRLSFNDTAHFVKSL
ncbi:hypothetical protein E4U14_005004 [Claviceps sp. LM454 group G7]|nr:hypothetical protein E4U14_005004 [Claviceps sp. LM454 group G7]